MRRLAVVLPLVLVVGCGGSGSGQAKSAYLKKAEAICAKANTDVKAVPLPSGAAALPAYVASLVRIADSATSQLEGLVPPKADKADLDKKFLTPLRHQVEQGKTYEDKIKAAVAAHDEATLRQLEHNPPTQSQADTAWMASYGFKACVESAKTG